jgi:hypothetical protein
MVVRYRCSHGPVGRRPRESITPVNRPEAGDYNIAIALDHHDQYRHNFCCSYLQNMERQFFSALL